MSPLWVLAIGLTIVIGGILWLRLHAFVALVLAGFAVALLTDAQLVRRSAERESLLTDVTFERQSGFLQSKKDLKQPADYVIVVEDEATTFQTAVGTITAGDSPPEGSSDGETKVWNYDIQLTADLPADATLGLAKSRDLGSAVDLHKASAMTRLSNAMGSYCAKLAILIVAASIIGRCLLDSGAASRIVTWAVQMCGEKNAPAAFLVSGFTLSIPVFFDTIFYLMVPLGQALRRRTGKNYLLYVLSIVAGGTMAHSLVPPTPGPLFIAEAFGVSLLSMIVGGCIVGLFSSCVGMIYAYWINGRSTLELPSANVESTEAETTDPAALESAPPVFVALIPVLLPVLLIALGSMEKFVDSRNLASGLKFVGEKNFALLVSAIFAVGMLVWYRRPSKQQLSASLQDAVSSAGTIILVTAAGGAFGRMMRQTNVAEMLQGLSGSSPVMIVVAAFLVTVAVRTAQGSATVAMITSAGIFGGLVANGAAGVDPLYVALAVGCGSKPIAWMNDSGFWVITRMSGMSEQQGLKFVTPMTALAGTAGLVAVIVSVLVFP